MNFWSADVPDPTDFPPQFEAPGLRTLDGSFRCDICGELYDAPVTIACGHCFCSACIRDSLSIKQECPNCRKQTGEGHIRPNPAIESVVMAWKEARPYILGLITREKVHASTNTQAHKGTAKKRKRSVTSTSSADRLKDSGNVAGPSHRSLSPNGANVTSPKCPPKLKKPKPNRDDAIIIPSSDAEENDIALSAARQASPQKVELVLCPVCQKPVQHAKINSHIDNKCKDSADTAATSWSKLMGGGAKNAQHKGKYKKQESDSDDEHPLPISTYATLKDKQVKGMLTEHDLPTTGNRTIWEQRHQRWVILFNSNLDKSLPNRRSKAELRKDLKKWEEDKVRKKKPVIKDPIGYQIEHKSEFARLTDQARQSKVKGSSDPKSDSHSRTYSSSPSIPPTRIPSSSLKEPGDTSTMYSGEE